MFETIPVSRFYFGFVHGHKVPIQKKTLPNLNKSKKNGI